MTSKIDPTLPVPGTPQTASVRANFQTAHDEISALQAAALEIVASEVAVAPAIGALGATVQAALTTLNGTVAPLASPVLTGDPKAPTAAPGDSDASIATTAFVQAAVAPALNNVGRNLLHNSLFNVTQRGGGPFAAIGYTADRWALYYSAGTAAAAIAPQTDGGRGQIGDEASTAMLQCAFTGGSTAGAITELYQGIENARRIAGKTVTVSFWAWSTGTLKLGVSLDQNFGTGGSPSPVAPGAIQAIGTTPAPARYSVTIAVPSAAGKTFGANGDDCGYLILHYSNADSPAVGVQSGTVWLWGVQLEIGAVATPLEKPDPQQDLANCQRFYQPGCFYFGGNNTAGTLILGGVSAVVAMRGSPTVTPAGANTSANVGVISYGSIGNCFLAWAPITATGYGSIQQPFTASADL